MGDADLRVFAIGDLHLPGGQDKPMDVFGDAWLDHPRRIAAAWRELVEHEDVVLMPGDLSWAMTLEEAREDLAYLGELPGTVILIKGNHDYWWGSISQVRRALPPNVRAIQNDHVPLPGGGAICGTRGWTVPGTAGFTEADEKVYLREIQRLELSLKSAARAGLAVSCAMLHYPPTNERHEPSGFTELLERHGVPLCVYGHLHGQARRGALTGERRGVRYELVACDAVGFRPVQIGEIGEGAGSPNGDGPALQR